MMHATPDGSYAVQTGSDAVRVGISDTGVDGSHPDISPNFDRELSRNFTVDDPVIDGPCEDEPDHSCTDPPDVDEDGHGTHVAGTIGAALNGVGIGGVAPGVDIVNLRAGQDSGFFFLQPTAAGSSRSGRSVRAGARPTTPTTASSRPTSRRRAATAATSSAPTATTRPTTGSSPRCPRAWPRPSWPPTRRTRSSCRTAPAG